MCNKNIFNTLLHNVDEVVPKNFFVDNKTTKKLRIKIGIDPTTPNLHLGHLVIFKKLREFQNFGHFVYCVIGNFTGQIGDPTGKKKTRVKIHKKNINKNCKTYEKQILTILDKTKTIFLYNATWLSRLRCESILYLLSQQTAARILERKDFKLRIKTGFPLSLCELSYPILQGYDSVVLASDVEFGGTDQKFNLLVGRSLQKKNKLRQQCAVLLPILTGTDGIKKMSKTTNNQIDISLHQTQLYGKIMSIRDSCIHTYYNAFGFTTCGTTPFVEKKNLAEKIVSLIHGDVCGNTEKIKFTKLFSEKKKPENIQTITIAKQDAFSIIKFFKDFNLTKSNKETKRLLAQRSIKINDIVIQKTTVAQQCENFLLQIGKQKYINVCIQDNN